MFKKYIISCLTLLMLAACSSDNNENNKNTTEKITKEIADKAVAAIQDPLEKARNAAQTIEEHNRQTEEYKQEGEN